MSRVADLYHRSFGRAPIHPLPFALAKLGALGSWLYFVAAIVTDPLEHIGAALLFAAGIAILFAGVFHLGDALRVGLPDEETRLRTRGIFAVTRNPIYVGLAISIVASLLAAPVVLNAVAATLAVGGHHLIIRAEERFLAGRFGAEWDSYARRVPRYVFRFRRHG